jgi:DNA-binding transcriptional LysR family regulator
MTPSPSPARPVPRFTLKQLHYFTTVARCGQISAAAAEVGLSQSAMTLAMAELERVLGAPLLDRGRSGVALTVEGHAFLQHANVVLQTASDAARLPFRRQTALSGTIELAATYTVLGYFLLPALARFQQLFPNIRVTLVERARPEIEAGLRSGQVQIAALLLSNLDAPQAVRTRVLARSRRQLWVADAHPLADQGSVTWDEIAGHSYILPTVDEGDRNALGYWETAGRTPTQVVRTSSMEALREMVALGLGVTILSDMVFRPWSLDGRRIRAVPVDARLPVMEVGLAWPMNQSTDAGTEACLDALQDFLGLAFNRPGHAVLE